MWLALQNLPLSKSEAMLYISVDVFSFIVISTALAVFRNIRKASFQGHASVRRLGAKVNHLWL